MIDRTAPLSGPAVRQASPARVPGGGGHRDRADFLSLAELERQEPAVPGKGLPAADGQPKDADTRSTGTDTPAAEAKPRIVRPRKPASAAAPTRDDTPADTVAEATAPPEKLRTPAKPKFAVEVEPTPPLPAPPTLDVPVPAKDLTHPQAKPDDDAERGGTQPVGDLGAANDATSLAPAIPTPPPILAGAGSLPIPIADNPTLSEAARRLVGALPGGGLEGSSFNPAGRPVRGTAPASPIGTAAAVALPIAAAPGTPTRPERLQAAAAHAPAATLLAALPPDGAAIQPAGIVFGAAMHAAIEQDDAPAPGTPDGDAPIAFVPDAAPAPAAAQAAVATAAPLDIRSERWMQTMVDHIEQLRDGADAGDTRMRLSPDALGSVGVSIRTDGDTIHVHFTAASAETRALLHEAQPRLAEIAGERGLKLGQSGVDGGSAQQDRPQAGIRPASTMPSAPPPAERARADSTATHRIA